MPPYNVNPAPRTGRGTYGMVPGTIDLPSPAADLGVQYPNLGGTNAALSRNILSGLEGQLSPGTINLLQDTNAAWGVASGMPGSQFAGNRLARNLGLTSEAIQQQALKDYASIIPTISRTQTVSPETQIGVAEQNALNLAAPDPAAAQSYAQQLYQRYLQGMSSPGGGTGRVASQGGPYTPIKRDWWEGGDVTAPSTSTATISRGEQMWPGMATGGPGAGASWTSGSNALDPSLFEDGGLGGGLSPDELYWADTVGGGV